MSDGNYYLSASVPAYDYSHMLLFDWNPDVIAPFGSYPRDLFPEIADSWLQGKLDEAGRLKILNFTALEGQEMSVFGKIEYGKSF